MCAGSSQGGGLHKRQRAALHGVVPNLQHQATEEALYDCPAVDYGFGDRWPKPQASPPAVRIQGVSSQILYNCLRRPHKTDGGCQGHFMSFQVISSSCNRLAYFPVVTRQTKSLNPVVSYERRSVYTPHSECKTSCTPLHSFLEFGVLGFYITQRSLRAERCKLELVRPAFALAQPYSLS